MKFSTKLKILALLLFVISRAHIWVNRPLDFSEVIYSYMPYAHLWASGVKPYLEQWYEYPPATIPLFYVPHVIDMTTRYWPVHIDYLHAYRGLLLVADCLLFGLVWAALAKAYSENTKEKKSSKSSNENEKPWLHWLASIAYYCGVTALANHFIYDTMDWTFAAALSAAATMPLLLNAARPSSQTPKNAKKPLIFPQLGFVGGWIGYFLATALKYVNAPLGLPQLVSELPVFSHKITLKNLATYIQTAFVPLVRACVALGIGAVIVWGVPVFLYRSSLQVSVLYHQLRGLQVDTPAAIIVRTLNESTHSEKIIEVYKNYEVSGPLSSQALAIVDILFPVALLIWGIGVSWLLWRNNHKPLTRAWFTLGFILLFMLTGKVLSRPFLLWHIPFIALLPLTKWRLQIGLMALSLAMIWVSFYPISNDAFFGLPLPIWVGWVRTVLIVSLFGLWWIAKDEFLTKPSK